VGSNEAQPTLRGSSWLRSDPFEVGAWKTYGAAKKLMTVPRCVAIRKHNQMFEILRNAATWK